MTNGGSRRFRRALLVVGVLGLGACLAPAAASAAPGGTGHTVTYTDHIHGAFTEPNFTQNPCSGALITSFDAYGNVVDHVTYFPAGDEVWATFTETGKATITLAGSDGSTLTGHEVQHFALNANGVVTVDFDTFRLICG